MKTPHLVRLLDGEFDTRDALHIIDTLLEAKINFHRSQRFSHTIRGTEDRVGCSQRIAELQEARRRFAAYIDKLPAGQERLVISGNISLKPAPKCIGTAEAVDVLA